MMMMMSNILIAALCCASISFTITTTSIFRGFRDWLGKFHPKLDELIHCPWCLNHYIVLLWWIIGQEPFNLFDTISYIFSIICLGGLIHYVLIRAYEPIAKRLLERKLKQKNNED